MSFLRSCIALAIAGAACFSPSYSDETMCSMHSECPPGRMCVSGLCKPAGAPSVDAPPGTPDAPPGTPDAPPQADAPAGTPDAPAGMPDAPPTNFVPVHVLASTMTMLNNAPDLILGATNNTIDTSALTVNGATSAFFVAQSSGNVAVLFANAFSVQNPTVITGSRPLIVVARDVVTITTRVDLHAENQSPGPGASTAGAGGPGGTLSGTENRESAGGGGASYGSLGAPGGTDNPGTVAAGASGARYGGAVTDPLAGGSSGGLGGSGSVGGAGTGGGGGGALQISSFVSITLSTGTTINAGGGGGRGGGTGQVGGGGGGSGGEIVLEAPTIRLGASITVVANGGGGGGGGAAGMQSSTDGGDGAPGPGQASGGTGGVPQGSNGGLGAAGVSGSFIDATAGSGFNSKGGGGGGGAGRIFFRFRSTTPPTIDSSARVSPPASNDSTL